jgi:DNA-binding GntR family transcriptional regulator
MEDVYLQQLTNKPLREQILNILRSAIISGEFKPGQPLVESEIATRLGVSRAPVREALQTLSAEALVDTVPYHGTVVKVLNRRDIVELYSLRAVFEIFAIQRIIELNTLNAISTLRVVADDMMTAAQAGDIKLVTEIDRQFHDTLIRLGDHQLLAMSWNNISMRVRQVMALRNRRFSDLTQIAYNHIAIIDAIDAANEELAIRLIREHIASSGDLLAEMWDDEEITS